MKFCWNQVKPKASKEYHLYFILVRMRLKYRQWVDNIQWLHLEFEKIWSQSSALLSVMYMPLRIMCVYFFSLFVCVHYYEVYGQENRKVQNRLYSRKCWERSGRKHKVHFHIIHTQSSRYTIDQEFSWLFRLWLDKDSQHPWEEIGFRIKRVGLQKWDAAFTSSKKQKERKLLCKRGRESSVVRERQRIDCWEDLKGHRWEKCSFPMAGHFDELVTLWMRVLTPDIRTFICSRDESHVLNIQQLRGRDTLLIE